MVLYVLNMLLVLCVCAFTARDQRYVHVIIGMLIVLSNTSICHFLLYMCLVLANLLAMRVTKRATYPLLLVNLGAIILSKMYSKTLGIDISSKNNITIQLLLLAPQMFYLSKARAEFLESLEYVFFLPCILAGPVIPYEQYRQRERYLEEQSKKTAEQQTEGMSARAVHKILEAGGFACLMMLIKKTVPFEYVMCQKNLPMRVLLLYIYGLGFRCQYYLIWAFSSACYRLCGHDVVNISFLDVELAQNLKDVSKHWNTYTAVFLKESIFDPLKTKNVFVASIATFVGSSLLHGGHPSYFMMFISLGLSILAMRNNKKLVDTYLWPLPAKALNATIVSLFISYVSVPFYFLNVRKALCVWKSVWWYGHLMVLFLYALNFAVPAPRKIEKKRPD